MDLNLYLGVPPRRPEPDLGSDLALGSFLLRAEMSNSHIQSNYPISRSTQPSQNLEYCPYYPSLGHVSPRAQANLDGQTLSLDDVGDPLEHPPYFPSYVQTETGQDSTEAMIVEGSSNNDVDDPFEQRPCFSSYFPTMSCFSPPALPYELLVEEENIHIPYVPPPPTQYPASPTYIPRSPTNSIASLTYSPDSPTYSPHSPTYNPHSPTYNPQSPTYTPLSPTYTPQVPVAQVQDNRGRGSVRSVSEMTGFGPYQAVGRLFELDHSISVGRHMSPVPEGLFLSDIGRAFHDTTVLDELIEIDTGNQIANVEENDAEDIGEEGMKDQGNGVADFDCNVCLDVAKEPVVTSCGHLFCWPCLYQWLHLHCHYKECPVCKGEVTESSITPIYGRGSFAKEAERKLGDDRVPGLKIPPRPRGHRSDSLRQRILRPLFQRPGEIGAWRLIIDSETHN